MAPHSEQIQALKQYTACDISDALLKLKVPNYGFLPDLKLYTSPSTPKITIAPASTVLFVHKEAKEPKDLLKWADLHKYADLGNIPAGKHYVDLTEPETIVVISQPTNNICAALGGIMALRMKVRCAKGVVVHGRVRDVEELNETGLPIWAKATSITGTSAEIKPWALQVDLDLQGTIVRPGDLVFSDAVNGVVVIPTEKVDQVIEMLPRLVEADDRVKEDVAKGMTVQEAFKKRRG